MSRLPPPPPKRGIAGPVLVLSLALIAAGLALEVQGGADRLSAREALIGVAVVLFAVLATMFARVALRSRSGDATHGGRDAGPDV